MAEQIIPPVEVKPAVPDASEVERKKREAEIKKRGAELKAEKDTLNKQRSEILAEQKRLDKEKADLAEFNKWRSTATVDPDAFLTPVYGKDWRDKLAKATAGDTTPLAIQQLREEWEKERKTQREAEEKRKADEKAEQDAKAKAEIDDEERTFAEYAKDISTTWIETHKEEFPSLHATGLALEVAKRVREIHKTTGEMPDEVAVAKDLEEKLDKILEGVYGTKKWSEKLAAKLKAAPPVRKTEPPAFEIKRKSISQDMAPGSKQPTRPLTRDERREKLLGMSDEEWKAKVAAK